VSRAAGTTLARTRALALYPGFIEKLPWGAKIVGLRIHLPGAPEKGGGAAPRTSVAREGAEGPAMIRKLKSGEYRLYSRKTNPKTGKRRNLGTFATREKAEQHERAVQYFKHH